MRKILDAFLGSVKDGIHPREIALAVALGVIAGFVTGWNLTLLVILVAVVLLRVPFQMFGQAWAVSAMAAWMMTPATFHTGRYMLEESPLAATFAASADSWTMVLFDLDRYTLIGGLVWGLLLAIPCAWLTLRFSRSLQVRLRKVGEKIKSASFSIRAICWLMFGSLEGVTQPPKDRWLLRPFGALCCLLTVVPMSAMAWMYGPTMMENSILMTLSRANQAEVAADSFELSLSDGTLQVQNLQIADADQLDHDRMRVASLVAVIKPAPMLRGRVHIEKIIIDGITCNVERVSAAKAYPLDLPDFDIDPHVHFDGSLEDLGYKLETYARNWLEIKDRMNQVQDMLARVDALVHRDDEEPEVSLEIPAEYRAMREMRSTFGSPRPSIVVELIRAKHLAPQWGMSDEAMLEITNLNSEPKLLGCPTRVEFAEPDHSLECVAELNYHKDAPHHLHLTLANVAMTELINWEKMPNMAVAGGTLTFHGDGTFDSHGLELPLQVRMDRMSMTLPGGTRQLGLPSELWNQGLAQLGGMQLAAKLHGEWDSPRLDVDTEQLVAQFQNQLHAAGHAMLATAVNEQVQRGQNWVQEQASEHVARGQEYVNQGRDAAEGALQSGRDAVADFGQDVQSQLNQTNNQIQNAQDSINNKIQDTVNRALGGMQNQEDLANQFLQNRLNGSNDRYGQNPIADAASGLIGTATGNVRQGLNHIGANSGHVIDVAGNSASGALDQATDANAAAQNTANNGLDAGQNIVGNADQNARYGLQGAGDQANRYAQNAGQAANDAVNQFGPATVSGGATQTQTAGGANVPAEVPLQSPGEADCYGDRYADYYAQAAAQQQGTSNQQASVPPAGTNTAPATVPQVPASQTPVAQTPARNGATNGQVAGNQQQPATQQPVGEPAALLYPESMRSARQLPPPRTTAQTNRYEAGVQQTADQAAGANGYPNSNGGYPENRVANGATVAGNSAPSTSADPQGSADRYNPDRYADFYQRAETQLEQRPTPPTTAPNNTGQRGNPPGPEYYAGTQGTTNNAANSAAVAEQSRYGAVQDFMEEVGQRSAATAGRPNTNRQQTQQANNSGNGGLPKMASSSVASDVGTSQAQRPVNRNAGAIPPVGFNRGYVPQEPFTQEEYQALLLMQQQQQAGTAQASAAQVGTTQAAITQPQQGSSWKKLANTVTGGAKKLWPFSRSEQAAQGTAAAGDVGHTQQQYAGGTYPSNNAQAAQQQAYQTASPQQSNQVQQAEAPKDPWYKRLFRR